MPSDADIALAKEVLLARRKERQWSKATKKRVAGYSFAAVSATPDPGGVAVSDEPSLAPAPGAVGGAAGISPATTTATAAVSAQAELRQTAAPRDEAKPPPRLHATALPQRDAPTSLAAVAGASSLEAGAEGEAHGDTASSVPDESSLVASPTRHHSDPTSSAAPPVVDGEDEHPPTARGSTLRPRDVLAPAPLGKQPAVARVNSNAGVIAAQRRIVERRHAQAAAPPPPPTPADDDGDTERNRPPPPRKPPLPFRKREEDPAELLFFAEKQREQRGAAPTTVRPADRPVPTRGVKPGAVAAPTGARRSSSAAAAPTSVHQRRVVAGRARAVSGGAPVQDRVVMHVGQHKVSPEPGPSGAKAVRPAEALPAGGTGDRGWYAGATPSSAASRGPSSVSSGSTSASSRPPLPRRPPPPDGPRFIATPASAASSGAVAANVAGMLPVGRFSSAASVTDTTLTTRSSQAPVCAPPSPDKQPVQLLQPRRARSTGDAIGSRRQPAVRFATDLPPARDDAENDADATAVRVPSARDRLGRAIATGTGVTWQEEALLDAIEATNRQMAAAESHGTTARNGAARAVDDFVE